MNVPNRLTLLRVALIPLCVGLFYAGARIACLCVFVVASLTDLLDGYLARKYHLVTDLGKFLDPVADKLLVLSLAAALVGAGEIASWVLIVMLARELTVDGLRLAAAARGQVIAAGKLGKIKTTLQMAALILCLIFPANLHAFSRVAVYAAAAMTLWSGADYIVRGRGALTGDTRDGGGGSGASGTGDSPEARP